MIHGKARLPWQRLFVPTSLSALLICIILGAMFLHPTTVHAVCTAPNYAVTDSSMFEIGLTGDITLTASLSESADALARDPDNCNLLYYVGKSASKPLYVMDLSVVPTPTSTFIGNTGLPGQVRKLGFNPMNGQLYTIRDGTNELVTISLTTATPTAVGSVSGFSNSGGDLTFDEFGVIWMIHNNRLYTMSLDLPLTPNELGSVSPPGGLGSLGWGDDGLLYGVRFDTGAVYNLTYTTGLNITLVGTLNLGGEEINDIASVHPVETFPTAVLLRGVDVFQHGFEWAFVVLAACFLILTSSVVVFRNLSKNKR